MPTHDEERIEMAYTLLKQVLGEANFQAQTTRLENDRLWICMVGRQNIGIAGLPARYMLTFKLHLDSGHVDYYVQYPTLPSRIKDVGFIEEIKSIHAVHSKIEPVSPELFPEQSKRGDVWIQFGAGFQVEKMTPEFLEDVTKRLCGAVEDCIQLIPGVDDGPRSWTDLQGLFQDPT